MVWHLCRPQGTAAQPSLLHIVFFDYSTPSQTQLALGYISMVFCVFSSRLYIDVHRQSIEMSWNICRLLLETLPDLIYPLTFANHFVIDHCVILSYAHYNIMGEILSYWYHGEHIVIIIIIIIIIITVLRLRYYFITIEVFTTIILL